MKVITYKSNGRTRYSISDDKYIPLHPLITYYLQVELGKKSSNTLERKSYELLFILKYFKKRGIDLIQSIEELNFISEECSAQLNQDTFLKEFCSYSTGDRSSLAV